ncbi:hypothetical protein COHA_001331 [Chlorella ohadii]|uniref:Adaptor-related protein complex 5 beta subunit n=1 Tax=Chlorella ohadii TaxID=2649997 RepID=A0AAD5DY07_9CHLO|nr:hypothetical protein COHA_001331 [Chlorella ohadii]
MGKKKQALLLDARSWRGLVESPAALQPLLQTRPIDVLRQLQIGLSPGGALACEPLSLRLAVLSLLEQHAVVLCADAPQDAVRGVYEAVRDRTAQPALDGPEGTARAQLAALQTLTRLLVACEMQQRDARLVKVHVELLFRILERTGPYAAASPELCRCAAACLRRMEEEAPTLLLSGAKQLLDLARAETSRAAEAYAMLAARVLSHGAARCLDARLPAEESSNSAAAPAAHPAAQQHEVHQRPQHPRPAPVPEGRELSSDEVDRAFSVLSSIDVGALSMGAGGSTLSMTIPGTAAHTVSPAGTLEAAATAFASVASGRTRSHGASSNSQRSEHDGCCSPDAPDSPRGVASLAASTAASTLMCSSSGGGPVAPPSLLPAPSIASNGSSHLDGSAALPLLVTDLQKAAVELMAAVERMSVEGVACLVAALPPILRLAELAPAQLQDALDSWLYSGRTLLLQAVLKLHPQLPPGFEDWKQRLSDTLLLMVNGPHPAEQRIIAITWALVQHHAQMHSQQPSLFAGAWRQLLPRGDDPAQLLSLKIKALSACLAVGIGRAEQICPLIFAWDGFWQAAPTDQQQRLASYALRMLGSAAVSYAALPREAVERCRRCAAMSETVSGFKAASRPAATPHFVKACLFSACLQLLATRPQYLPAVEGFLGICGSGSCRGLQADLLNAIDALFSAAASAGQFASLAPPPRGGLAIARHRSVGGRLQGSPAEDSSGSPRSGGSGSGLGAVLRRMKTSLSLRFASPGQTPEVSPAERCQSLQVAAEQGLGSGPLPSIAEGPTPLGAPVPQPPVPLASWDEAEAWLWDARTWTDLGAAMLQHDPLAYRPLLLRLSQSGTSVLPMGALRLLAAYASQYQGDCPGHQLSSKEAGQCVLAICQAAAMTHLLIGPAGSTAQHAQHAQQQQQHSAGAHGSGGKAGWYAGRGRSAARAAPSDDHSVRGASPCSTTTGGSCTPQWTQQQEAIALAMQAVLSALTSHFPVDSVRRRAQSFLDLLNNPSAWGLKVRVGTMASMLGSFFHEAINATSYL